MALPFPVPASLDASFTMSRPTEADINAMADIYYDSFSPDPGFTYWWSEDREGMFAWLHARIRRKMSDRSVRHFMIVDDQSEVVAFARWDIPKGYEAAFGEWVGIDDNVALDVSQGASGEEDTVPTAPTEAMMAPAPTKDTSTPAGSNSEQCEAFFAKLAVLSKKWDAERMLDLSLLCTAPKYHRRGAGRALLVPVLAIADAVGLRTYVEATPAGRPLYEKLGFREVENIALNAAAATAGRVKGTSVLSIMIREPQLQ
ncbi:hypothetical protein F4808DRAFT_19304 [Astrocystis sublimbata]|nr:hypothetical protein F4808DRAFT_19304 [Astrocystis sublimbata]